MPDSSKLTTKSWIVLYRTADTHEITGPPWGIESRIRPTKWAREHAYGDRPYQYAIKQVPEDQDGIRESELVTLKWEDIPGGVRCLNTRT